jgi:hypothetical protein
MKINVRCIFTLNEDTSLNLLTESFLIGAEVANKHVWTNRPLVIRALWNINFRCSKVKESRNRPGVVQSVLGGLCSQILWHSAREGEVSLTHRPPLPPGMFLVLIFTRCWVDPRAMVRSEGNMSLKNPVTPPGIDPGTVRLVAYDHYATPGPFQL